VTISVRPAPPDSTRHFQVSYEGFIDDVRVGDFVVIDGGMVIVQVEEMAGPDVFATVVEPGKVMSRASLTLRRGKELVRGKSSMLPVVTGKDWQDIDFAVEQKVRCVCGCRCYRLKGFSSSRPTSNHFVSNCSTTAPLPLFQTLLAIMQVVFRVVMVDV
jgi:hypothetical protein